MTTRAGPDQTLETTLQELSREAASRSSTKAHTTNDALALVSPTPFPLFNNVVRTRFEEDAVDRRIEDVLDVFRKAHRPMLWWVGPWTRPENLDQRLPDHELRPFANLALTTFTGSSAGDDDGLVVERAEGLDLLDAWLRPEERGYVLPPTVSTAFLGADAVAEPDAPLRHYRARRGKDIVGYASLFCGSEEALVCNVCAASEIGLEVDRLLLASTLEEAERMGYEQPVALLTERGEEAAAALDGERRAQVTQFLWMDLTDPQQPMTGV